MPNVNKDAAGGPYTIGDGGYYKDSDHSGPYAIDSNGNASMLTTITSSTTALPAGTDRSGTAGTSATTLAPANSNRKKLNGQNIMATGDLWINETGGTAAVDAVGSFKVGPGQTFNINTNRAISVIGSVAGVKYTATET